VGGQCCPGWRIAGWKGLFAGFVHGILRLILFGAWGGQIIACAHNASTYSITRGTKKFHQALLYPRLLAFISG
jgi:hypothetical protein